MAVAAMVGGALLDAGLTKWFGQANQRRPLDEVIEEVRCTVVGTGVSGADCQLDHVLRRRRAFDLVVDDLVLDGRRPLRRGRSGGSTEFVRRWAAAVERLVILGEPGYGKTVLSLLLVARGNDLAATRVGAPLVIRFPLSDWARWTRRQPGASLDKWLVAELKTLHPAIDRRDAESIVTRGLLVPVLDGLDEVPSEMRVNCKASIDAFASRAPPYRCFVVTSRAEEYRELAPDWVEADQHVVVGGLDRPRLEATLRAEANRRPQWGSIRSQVENGDLELISLLRCPLRLGIALQVYREGDPSELIGVSPQEARNLLWERFLGHASRVLTGFESDDVRRWLGAIARGLVRNGRQRFGLHELYLFHPKRRAALRRFRIVLGLSVALVFGVAMLVIGPAVFAAAGVPIGALAAMTTSERPVVRRAARPARLVRRTVLAATCASVVGLILGVALRSLAGGDGLRMAVSGAAGSVSGGFFIALVVWFTGTHHLMPSDAVTGHWLSSPESALNSTVAGGRSAARLFAICAASALASLYIFAAVLFSVVVGPIPGRALLEIMRALVDVIAFAALVAFVGGVFGGYGTVLYHRWLRWRLKRMGLLPHEPEEFLRLCASPEWGCLRSSGPYEFRHRDLLEYLASAPHPRAQDIPPPLHAASRSGTHQVAHAASARWRRFFAAS